MRAKPKADARRAQAAEAAVLLTVVAWSTWLASSYYADVETGEESLVRLLPRVLQVLNATAFGAVAWALLVPRAVPQCMEELSRRERDAGIAAGSIIAPLVLLSRFLAVAHSNATFSAPTLLYMWISTTASASLLIKIVAFGSCGVLPTLAVDGMLLPVSFGLLGVESDLRFVLPTFARIFIGLAFRFGRLALRRSFTVGEALLVAQIVAMAAFDLALITVVKLSGGDSAIGHEFPSRFISAWHLHGSSLMDRAPYQLALQVGVVGALLICVALTPILSTFGSSSPHVVAPPLPLIPSAQFCLVIVSMLGGIVYPWSCFLLDTWNPFGWLLTFVFEDSSRWHLVSYWIVCLVIFIPASAAVSRLLALRQIIARKLFHLLVLIMFVPAFFIDSDMLALSYGVAFAAFCLVECVRAVSLPPIGHSIAVFVRPFIDHREGGRVILTHTYLLLGCALPIWLAPSSSASFALAANAGVIVLGVGDAMGAVVGSTYGKRKLFGSKTLEGTAAVLVSTLVASLALHYVDLTSVSISDTITSPVIMLAFGATLSSALEAATAQIDNLILSLFAYAMANLTVCHA